MYSSIDVRSAAPRFLFETLGWVSPLTCSFQVLALLDGPLEELVALAIARPGQDSGQDDYSNCDVSIRSHLCDNSVPDLDDCSLYNTAAA